MSFQQLAAGKSISGLFSAQADGYVIVQISQPAVVTNMAAAVAAVSINGVTFTIVGGTSGNFGSDWSDTMYDNPSALTIPVQQGDWFRISGYNMSGVQEEVGIAFYWKGFTDGTPQSQSDENAANVALPTPPQLRLVKSKPAA